LLRAKEGGEKRTRDPCSGKPGPKSTGQTQNTSSLPERKQI
jgi:hypothetical protein